MYSDKMLEYLILVDIIRTYEKLGMRKVLENNFDFDKMCKRLDELSREFLEPYAIKSDSKE